MTLLHNDLKQTVMMRKHALLNNVDIFFNLYYWHTDMRDKLYIKYKKTSIWLVFSVSFTAVLNFLLFKSETRLQFQKMMIYICGKWSQMTKIFNIWVLSAWTEV